MKASVPWFVGLAVLLVGACLTASPALAKCHKDCKTQIENEFKACKVVCPKGKAGKDCKHSCKTTKRGSLAACKIATNPTPPDCGETTITTTTTTTTTTTLPSCSTASLCSHSCAQMCVTFAASTSLCGTDADCPPGQVCATPLGGCPDDCGSSAACGTPYP